jgi:NADH-quinone oxidoreductase subunit J
MVITSRNPVNAVLFLVSVFVLTAIMFIIVGAEFFAILLFTVYVGAIAVLFLFVVMMFNLRLMDLYGKTYYHMPSGF